MSSRIMMQTRRPEDRGLLWIGGFKLLMGLLLGVFASGLIALVHTDFAAVIKGWADALDFDHDNRYVTALLEKAGLVTPTGLWQLSALSFVYAGLLLTEGVGLMKKKKWAEWLTVIVTGSLIPLEIYGVLFHFGPWKLIVLVVNVVIVWYLIWVLQRQAKKAGSPTDS